jgi:hypothetical protein
MRWRPAQSADKMRRRLGGIIKSVYNAQARGDRDGNGSEQSLLRKLNAQISLGRNGLLAHNGNEPTRRRARCILFHRTDQTRDGRPFEIQRDLFTP